MDKAVFTPLSLFKNYKHLFIMLLQTLCSILMEELMHLL